MHHNEQHAGVQWAEGWTSGFGMGAESLLTDAGRDPSLDPVEAYFECITTCSLDDGDCVTTCTEILRQHS